MQVGKLAPVRTIASGITTQAAVNFPGFQQIWDFTSAGSEASATATVNGDTDKEYLVIIRDVQPTNSIYVRLNGDSGASAYGNQYLQNNAGAITSGRNTVSYLFTTDAKTLQILNILTPTGFLKTSNQMFSRYSTGTTIDRVTAIGAVYNSTSNVTAINFVQSTGNFTAGTRITVYCRRSNV